MDGRKMTTMFWKRKVLPFTKIAIRKTPVTNKSDTDFQKLDEDEDLFTKLCCFSGNHNSFKQTIKPSRILQSLHLVDKNSNTPIIRVAPVPLLFDIGCVCDNIYIVNIGHRLVCYIYHVYVRMQKRS